MDVKWTSEQKKVIDLRDRDIPVSYTHLNLVSTGKEIENNYCIPIVNKRISVTPIALVGGAACKSLSLIHI